LSKRIVRALCVKRALDLVERDADALDDCRRVGGDEPLDLATPGTA
jgi:hypothetical protein